jgi:hypothetical protein
LRRRKHALERQMADIRYYLLELEQPSPDADAAMISASRKEALERTQAIRQALHRVDRALVERFRVSAVS